MRCNCECEPRVHPAAVPLSRRVDELLDLGEAHDLFEAASNLGAPHSEYRPAQENVFSSGELWMESRSHFQKRSDSSEDFSAPVGGLGDSRQNFEKSALPRTVSPHDSDDFTFRDVEGH